jgi:hypothetical protein
MCINGVSTIVSFTCWVIYILIGSRHPFIRYWQPSLIQLTTRCSLRHPDNEHQPNIHSFTSCIVRNQGIAWIIVCITLLFSAFICKMLYIEGEIQIPN